MSEEVSPQHVQTSSVIATAGINAVVFLVLVLLFELLRSNPKFEDVFAPKAKWMGAKRRIAPKAGVFAWIRQVLKDFSDAQLFEQVGMDGYVTIRFLYMMAKLSGVVSVLGMTILAPLYATSGGDDSKVEGIGLFTMANIPNEGKLLWASFIFNYVFAFLFIYFLYKEYENFVEKRQLFMKSKTGVTGYSVLLENIPAEHNTSETLTHLIEKNFPGEVMAATVAMNCPGLSELLAERLKICTNLENETGKYIVKNERPMKKFGALGLVGEKVDAINHWEKELERINELITRHQDDAANDSPSTTVSAAASEASASDETSSGAPHPISMMHSLSLSANSIEERLSELISIENSPSASTTAFVTMSSRKSRDAMIATPILYDGFREIEVLPAPDPQDIIWSNAPATILSQESGTTVNSLVLAAGLVFWSAIVSFVGAISSLSTLEKYLPLLKKLDEPSRALLQGILPVVAIQVLLALVPIIIAKLSTSVGKRKTLSEVQRVVFYWTFFYYLANVFIIVVAGSIFSSLTKALADPQSILDLLGTALPGVSTFFINFVLTALLIRVPAVNLRPMPLITYWATTWFEGETVTDRVLFNGPLAPDTMYYGSFFPHQLYIVALFAIYWTIAPILGAVCCAYFFAMFVVYRYQFLFVTVPTDESGGLFFHSVFAKCFLVLKVSAITQIGYLSIKLAPLQASLMVPLPIIIHFAMKAIENKFMRAAHHLAYDTVLALAAEEAPSFDKPAYAQPDLVDQSTAVPRSFRIDDTPLYTEQGSVDAAYYARSDLFCAPDPVCCAAVGSADADTEPDTPYPDSMSISTEFI
jgi:hypothetical protein